MSVNCNCYRCGRSTCLNQCTCVTIVPDYSALGCINNFTECIIYNGANIPSLSIAKNENMNVILQHLKDNATSLQTQISDISNNAIITTKVSLTSADILDMFTTPFEIVAAQGGSTIIQPLFIYLVYTFGTVAYSLATDIYVGFDGEGDLLIINSVLDSVDNSYYSGPLTPDVTFGAVDGKMNTPLVIYAKTANPTLGDGTLDVYITYTILTLT